MHTVVQILAQSNFRILLHSEKETPYSLAVTPQTPFPSLWQHNTNQISVSIDLSILDFQYTWTHAICGIL